MTKLILILLAVSTVVMGCGPKPATSTDFSSKPQTFDAHQELVATAAKDYFAYELIDSGEGCSTGRHEFDDHAELCRALADEVLNHYCAWQQRRDYAAQEQCR